MNYRALGRTGWSVSEISFGAWAIGGSWGPIDDDEALAAMRKAVDLGVNLIDTADVYGDGHSERLVRRFCEERSERIIVATKAGRRLNPHTPGSYERQNLEAFIDRSRENLGVEALDLLQLHCPPSAVYDMREVFDSLDDLARLGKIRHWGVSVERIDEAMRATMYEHCQTVQIVFNLFRQQPAERFLEEAKRRQVGVLARLPLSSGMLTGKFRADSQFASDDHRSFNREGAAFDKGETFSGVPYEAGLAAVEKIRALVPSGMSLASLALRWILTFDGVAAAIPGGRTAAQVEQNCAASEAPEINSETMARLRKIYDDDIRPYVHDRW